MFKCLKHFIKISVFSSLWSVSYAVEITEKGFFSVLEVRLGFLSFLINTTCYVFYWLKEFSLVCDRLDALLCTRWANWCSFLIQWTKVKTELRAYWSGLELKFPSCNHAHEYIYLPKEEPSDQLLTCLIFIYWMIYKRFTPLLSFWFKINSNLAGSI